MKRHTSIYLIIIPGFGCVRTWCVYSRQLLVRLLQARDARCSYPHPPTYRSSPQGWLRLSRASRLQRCWALLTPRVFPSIQTASARTLRLLLRTFPGASTGWISTVRAC